MRHGFPLFFGVILMIGLFACSEAEVETPEIIRPVKAMKISMSGEIVSRKFPGRAKASQEVTLAFEVEGKLERYPVNIGDLVPRNAVLAVLDPRDFVNALEGAKAELKRSKAQYERVKIAAAINAVSKQDLSDAEAAHEAAQARVGIREKALEDATLRAPYDAIVVATYVENFENIRPKQPIIRLINPTTIEMVVNIPEDIISRVNQVKDVRVSFDVLPSLVIPAVIKEIGTEASATTRTYPITLSMNQPKEAVILPGMAGKAWSEYSPEFIAPAAGSNGEDLGQRFNVPLTAIYADKDGNEFVWIINEGTSQVAKHSVLSGDLTRDGIYITGLAGGEIIATAGVNTLEEGQQVRVME